ncbi:MAG: hypothetical protein GY875_01370 [Gammaproteobacteria bacterium]|nr:hypothetical protein [Gammaproteobacteria bacterium]
MNRDIDSTITLETSRLLAELDQAINRSDAIRDIVRRWERLHDMERVIGPSRRTRVLHKEIMLLEGRIRSAQVSRNSNATLASPPT